MGTAKQGLGPLQIIAFWADTQIMLEIVATNRNGGITQGRYHGRYLNSPSRKSTIQAST